MKIGVTRVHDHSLQLGGVTAEISAIYYYRNYENMLKESYARGGVQHQVNHQVKGMGLGAPVSRDGT